MKSFFKYILLIFIIFSSCYTNKNVIENLPKVNENINVALRITSYIRTTEFEPDSVYIENLRTFEIYKLIKGNDKYFYIENIPAGQYRVGFFICSYKVNRVEFKILFHSNMIYNLSKSGNYLLGSFFYQYAVVSDKVSPLKVEVKEIKKPLQEFYNYNLVNNISTIPIEKSHLYRISEYGRVYPISVENSSIEADILNTIKNEKEIINGYFKIIDREFSKNGLDNKVLDLILGYYIITNNINLIIKKALLYYSLNMIDESLKIFEEIIKIDPNIPEYYSVLGELEFKNENLEKSKIFLYRAISNNSAIVNSYDLYAKILIKENDYKNAKIFSNYSLQKEPNNIEYIKTNIEIYKKLGDKNNIIKLEKKYMDLTNGR